jgi:Metallo-peptidase family M12B Reprolysin-like/Secretion system C-terminal sorting domain
MTKIYTGILFFCFLFLTVFSSFAQKRFFADVSESSIQLNSAQRVIIPQKFRTLRLNDASLKSFLWALPKEEQLRNSRSSAPILEIPMPDGKTATFRVWESSIQEPALEARFPEIKTFAGQGINDPYATIRFDYTPRGFHAQVLTVNGSYYIDPYAVGSMNDYISYFRTDLIKPNTFMCEVQESINTSGVANNPQSAACLGTDLRTYRLAVACTGEYAQAPGIAAGTNPAILHAAIVTSVNRVVGVYEKEVSIRLILVANNNIVEYLDAATDPFNGNNNANVLINESQTVINANIGAANYDIGHTFSTGGGGLAQLNSPCGASKARGITGSPSPTGDAYDIDYVAHEVGHQFGGNHSMAGCGSSPVNTKYEVGSGTSIQAYAGICGAENIQPNSDPYFHAISFDEISNFVTLGNGATCAVLTATGNTLPVIAPFTNSGITIPISTPFTLSGSATDANADALTYNWEQWDFSGTATWNAGATAAANNTVPLFKSRIPKTTGTRNFPDMAVVLAGFPANPPSAMGGLKGETLSPVARAMKFKLTVRDNRAGGGGVVSSGSGGCQTAVDYQVNVGGTSPFTVAIPNGGESWEAGTNRTITWNVVGTDAAPFNVSNVKISLSTDGGLTYPIVLSNSTPNDGTEVLQISNTPSTTARVKVEAIGNIFFDISNANFTITPPTFGFNFSATTATTIACAGPSSAAITLNTTSNGGFVTPVILTASAVPAGTTVTFSPNPVVPGSATTVTLSNTQNLAAGTYIISINGLAGTISQNTTVTYIISAGTAPVIAAQPSNVAVCAGSNAVFTVSTSGAAATGYQWQSSPNGVTYTNIAGATAATYTATAVTTALNNFRYRVIVNGQCASATSAGAILTVQTAPSITAQPQAAVECVGNNAVFSVTASGTGLTYQWEFSTDGIAPYTTIAGATNNTYTVTGVTLAQNNYRYRVIVSGTCPAAVTSNAGILSVGNAAAINAQPVGTTVCVGQTATFTVVATGSSLTYQWQQSIDGGINFTNIAGATASTLNLPAVSASQNAYQYRVNVFSCTPTPIVSAVGTLTVNTLAAINAQPVSVVICEGGNTTFSTTAVGTGASYQWQVAAAGCAGTFTNIAGATTNTLAINSVTAAQNGAAYRVVVTGTCNTVTSSCATLTVNTAIVITAQPASTSACLPTQTAASFSVAVTGTAPTYQWQVSTNAGASFTNITGATSATLSLTGLTASMTGNQYRVVLNGTCTSNLVSSAATLTVNTLVEITGQPVNRSICAGANTNFTVTATGSTITYQWQQSVNGGAFVNIANAAPFSGASTATLALTNTPVDLNTYRFRVIVSGVPCGSVTSNIVTLTVNPLPSAVLVASGYTRLTPYVNTTLFTTVSPVGTYSYQWFRSGTLVAGATGSSLPVNIDGFGEYNVIVTDVNGCSSSSNRVTIADSVSNMVFVYPNPNRGQFQVRYYSANNTTTGYTVIVYDSKGARVYNKQFPISRTYDRMDINLNNVLGGVYMLEVRDANGKKLASSSVIIQ